jgi:hypothetical protein
MGWRESRGLALHQKQPRYPQNPDRQARTDSFEGIEASLSDLVSRESGVAERSPIVPFDKIGKIVDSLEARFLGIRPKGWLPESDRVGAPLSVLEEVARMLPDLNRHGWTGDARRRLLAQLQPGDRIVKVSSEFALISARPPRDCFRIWRCEA